jgi:2-iminobutanoate/2-iminopropanoate deaminase
MKEVVATNNAPAAVGPYSQAVVAGTTVYTSGQIPLTPDGELVTGTIEEETHRVMKNLEAVLKAAGAGLGDVVSVRIYLTDISLFKQVNVVYGSYFADTQPPARETVGVQALPLGARVEVAMVAVVS